MSYITFNPNQIVYIKDIGYATLVNCGSKTTITHKIQAVPEKKQSIYFDPDLFNSDIDSFNSKISQGKDQELKIQKKVSQIIVEKKSEQKQIEKIVNPLKVIEQESINIVQAKLQGGDGVMIYTPQKNLKKSIFIIIKSFLMKHKEQIIVEIQISKTIDSLRKLIFQQLDEPIANYYNIKLFSTNPVLTQLNLHTKTITQYAIKQNSKLILTADYAFPFKDITDKCHPKYKITLNNFITLVSTKIVEEPKKVPIVPIVSPPLPAVIALPSSMQQTVALVTDAPNNINLEPKQQKKEVTNPPALSKLQQKPQTLIPIEIAQQVVEQKIPVQSGPYHARCLIEYSSGKKYWEFKLQKLPLDQQDLVIGVCIPSKDSPNVSDYLWGYQVVSGKKIFLQKDKVTNTFDEQAQIYGYAAKLNDIIGVFLNFKNKTAILSFYKNSISCGEAFVISLQAQNKSLTPFVNIGGQSQITLDSKALWPLDLYRFK